MSRIINREKLNSFESLVVSKSGLKMRLHFSINTLFLNQQHIILLFDDITQAWVLKVEREKTKYFLENLVNSSVDAIISADMNGYITFFNRSATRIYGFAAEEVVDKMHVAQLYFPGEAKKVMQMLRSKEFGGVGKLNSIEQYALSRAGEKIPIRMTAAIIYNQEQEIGTVGIFSDMREKRKMEEKLQTAQNKLLIHERQIAMAELAGATAHELNQPLTVLLGSFELLEMDLAQDDPLRKELKVIEQELERISNVVKKIGQLTHYETKSYVGQTTIVDLEKSSTSEDQDIIDNP